MKNIFRISLILPGFFINKKSFSSTKINYFPKDYLTSREKFRQLSNRLKSDNSKVETGFYYVESTIDQDLTTDYIHIPSTSSSQKLILITTGLHGVEAYAGSAILQLFINEILPSVDLHKTGVILYHALNPFGFKYHRRVSENNIDLNRNSTSWPQEVQNPEYKNFNSFLNPEGQLSVNFFSKIKYYFKAIYFIARYGLKASRQAILQGQYKFSRGLYYGGNNQETLFNSFEKSLKEMTQGYSEFLYIDIHTGFGKRGQLHLFAKGSMPAEQLTKLKKIYSNYSIDFDSTEDFYKVEGDLTDFLFQAFSKKTIIPMVFEFGTMNNSDIKGSLESIYRMINENQGAQWGYKSKKDKQKTQELMLEMYNPSDGNWKDSIISKAQEILPRIISRFLES